MSGQLCLVVNLLSPALSLANAPLHGGAQLKLAECKMRVDAARLLIMRAVAAADAEALAGADPGSGARALAFPSALDSSLAKCFSNQVCKCA